MTFEELLEQKKHEVRLLELKKAALLKSQKSNLADNRHHKNFSNYLRLSSDEEKTNCDSAMKLARSFSQLCSQNASNLIKYMESSSDKEWITLTPMSLVENAEQEFSSKLSDFSKVLFLSEIDGMELDSEDISCENADNIRHVEEEVLRLQQAMSVAWMVRIEEELRCAELQAEVDYLGGNTPSTSKTIDRKLLLSQENFLTKLVPSATQKFGSSVLLSHEAVRLARQENCLERLKIFLDHGIIPQVAAHELIVMLAEVERLAAVNATNNAKEIAMKMEDWQDYYKDLCTDTQKSLQVVKTEKQKYNSAVFNLKKCLLTDDVGSEDDQVKFFAQPLDSLLASRKERFAQFRLCYPPGLQAFDAEVVALLKIVDAEPVMNNKEEETEGRNIIREISDRLTHVKNTVCRSAKN